MKNTKIAFAQIVPLILFTTLMFHSLKASAENIYCVGHLEKVMVRENGLIEVKHPALATGNTWARISSSASDTAKDRILSSLLVAYAANKPVELAFYNMPDNESCGSVKHGREFKYVMLRR